MAKCKALMGSAVKGLTMFVYCFEMGIWLLAGFLYLLMETTRNGQLPRSDQVFAIFQNVATVRLHVLQWIEHLLIYTVFRSLGVKLPTLKQLEIDRYPVQLPGSDWFSTVRKNVDPGKLYLSLVCVISYFRSDSVIASVTEQ